MTKNIKTFRTQLRRRLRKYAEMEMTHCGHEGPALLAQQEGEKLVEWVIEKVEGYEKAVFLLTLGERQ